MSCNNIPSFISTLQLNSTTIAKYRYENRSHFSSFSVWFYGIIITIALKRDINNICMSLCTCTILPCTLENRTNYESIYELFKLKCKTKFWAYLNNHVTILIPPRECTNKYIKIFRTKWPRANQPMVKTP